MSSPTSGLADVKLHFVDNVEDAGEFLRWLGERRPHSAISIDIETGEGKDPNLDGKAALSPWRGEIRLVQVGDGMQGWSIPWDDWKGVFYQGMKNYDDEVNCHNVAFEALWFSLQSNYQIDWSKVHDTMIMSQVINPLQRAGLKPLTEKFIDPQAAYLQGTLNEAFAKEGWTWGTVPINYKPYWAYGALDTVLTSRLRDDVFWDKVKPGAAYSIPYEIEMATRKIATRMEMNGARVDLDYSQKKYDELVGFSEQAAAWVKSQYGGASITSNIQLARLFESLGGEITEFTPAGGKSVNKDQIALFMRDGNGDVKQLAELVLKQRKAFKLANSYFLNFINGSHDGVVHPSINTLAARTSRMSVTEPALQTLPSGDATVRRAFIPRNENEVIIASDLDQVEFRITAALSQDPSLIKLFLEADATGGDVFTSIMRQVYADESLQKADPRRKLIKGVVYGKLYGAGVDKMALTAGVASHQMREVVDAFDGNYPGVKMLQKQIENIGAQRLKTEGQAYVNTKTGRRLPADSDRIYSLTNYLIQATAAEIFKKNLIKLDKADLTDMLVVPVHDEIVMQVPREDVEEVKIEVQRAMTTTEDWAIPLTAGVDGPFENWGQKYEK